MRSITLLLPAVLLLGSAVHAVAGEAEAPERRPPPGDLRTGPQPDEGRPEIAPIPSEEREELLRGLQIADHLGPGLATLRSQLTELQQAQAGPNPDPRTLRRVAADARNTVRHLLGTVEELERNMGRVGNAIGKPGIDPALGQLRDSLGQLHGVLDDGGAGLQFDIQMATTLLTQAESAVSSAEKRLEEHRNQLLQNWRG